MPPRKPGGKYKGAIKRQKGEETLMAEAQERRKKALEEHLKRVEAKRETDHRAAEELNKRRKAEEEAVKQRILNFLMNGNKGAAAKAKYFKAWIMGKDIYQREKVVVARDNAWRASCSCEGG